MSVDAIPRALAAAGLPAARSQRPLSGGCIHSAEQLELEDGRVVVVKMNDARFASAFEEEMTGLRRLADTGTVIVPAPLHSGVHGSLAVLIMTFVAPASATRVGWASFGRDLADLHRADAGRRYGFEIDNHLGATPQPNGWHDDWVSFNREHRIGHQVSLARRDGRLEASETRRLERLLDRLDRLLPSRPEPALIHGDLWSGNALPTVDDAGRPRVAVIDPAPSVGDGWADIAMMQLFGGFPAECLDAYTEAIGERPDDLERRLAVYRLYHLLNHLNLFGRGYAGQVMDTLRSLEAAG